MQACCCLGLIAADKEKHTNRDCRATYALGDFEEVIDAISTGKCNTAHLASSNLLIRPLKPMNPTPFPSFPLSILTGNQAR